MAKFEDKDWQILKLSEVIADYKSQINVLEARCEYAEEQLAKAEQEIKLLHDFLESKSEPCSECQDDRKMECEMSADTLRR